MLTLRELLGYFLISEASNFKEFEPDGVVSAPDASDLGTVFVGLCSDVLTNGLFSFIVAAYMLID